MREAGKRDSDYQEAWETVSAKATPDIRKDKEVLGIQEELLYRKNRLWAPKEIVQKILEPEHDTKGAGHMGQDEMIELIRRNFWWPRMNEQIIDFIQSCPEC